MQGNVWLSVSWTVFSAHLQVWLETTLSVVGTEWVGYATGRRELVSLGKLGAPRVVAIAGQAGPVLQGNPPIWRAIIRSSSWRGRQGQLLYRAKFPNNWPPEKESSLTSPCLPPIRGMCKDPITIGFAVWLVLPILGLTANHLDRPGGWAHWDGRRPRQVPWPL